MAAVDDDGLHEADKQHVEDELEWVPLSLTLVEYPQGKHIFNRCEFRSTMANVCYVLVTNIIYFTYVMFYLNRLFCS